MTPFATGLIVVGAVGVVAAVGGLILKKAVNAYGKMCFKKGAIAAREKDGGPSDMSVDPDTGENIQVTAEDLDEEAKKIAGEQIKSLVMIYATYMGMAAFIGKMVSTIEAAYSKITKLGSIAEELSKRPTKAVREIVYVVKEAK